VAEVSRYAITGALLRGRVGTWRVDVDSGVVDRIVPDDAGTVGDRPDEVVDLRGQLLLPGLVDLHVHLDKAYQLRDLERLGEGGGGIEGALRATSRLRDELTTDRIVANARRVLDVMATGGTVAARVHVEIGPSSPPDAVPVHVALAAATPDLRLEFVAFPQHGTTTDPGVVRRLAEAMAQGCTVVGGCPYADPDPLAHLDTVIGLAVDTGSPLDLHLDLSDDVDDLLLDQVVPRVEKAGLQGRVVVGHVTALTAAPPDRVREIAAAVAAAGITVVSIPTTDLFLSGRGSPQAPTRGVTRIGELADAGVPVALASNNYENAFTPVTMPSLTHAAWLACLTNHRASESQQLHLLDAITTTPRGAMAGPVPGLTVGGPIGAAAFGVADAVDVVRIAARPSWRFGPAGPRRLGPAS
jgi:cytosine deaminase